MPNNKALQSVKMKALITIVVFVVSATALVGFWNMDACLDNGGVYSNYGYTCTGGNSTFVPIWGRFNILLWVFILTPAGVFAFAVHRLFSKYSRA